MLAQPRIKVARYAAVMRFLVSFAGEDVNVVESGHQNSHERRRLACQAVVFWSARGSQPGPPTLCSGVAAVAFALRSKSGRLEARGLRFR